MISVFICEDNAQCLKSITECVEKIILMVDYIQKGDDLRERIKVCIERACQKYADRHEGTQYRFSLSKGTEMSCKYDDILFFETDASVPHRLILHTKRVQHFYYSSLDKVLAALPKNIFFQCHRSCIVNLNNLTESCKHELLQGKSAFTMQNGAECKVASGKRKTLLKYLEITEVH